MIAEHLAEPAPFLRHQRRRHRKDETGPAKAQPGERLTIGGDGDGFAVLVVLDIELGEILRNAPVAAAVDHTVHGRDKDPADRPEMPAREIISPRDIKQFAIGAGRGGAVIDIHEDGEAACPAPACESRADETVPVQHRSRLAQQGDMAPPLDQPGGRRIGHRRSRICPRPQGGKHGFCRQSLQVTPHHAKHMRPPSDLSK